MAGRLLPADAYATLVDAAPKRIPTGGGAGHPADTVTEDRGH